MRVSLGIEHRLGLREASLEGSRFIAELQPLVQYRSLILSVLIALDFLQSRLDVGFVHLVELGEDAVVAAVFLLHLRKSGIDVFQLGGQQVDIRLLRGEVAGDDEDLGDEITGPALVLLLSLFVH